MTLLNYYQIPSQIPKIICDEIIKQYQDDLTDAEVGCTTETRRVDATLRQSNVTWINNDNWIAGMMSHFALSANKHYFKFDIDGYRREIQFTRYVEGDFYGWHIDTDTELLSKKFTRKLSIIMCLSSKEDYEGGELELFYPASTFRNSFKLDYGDVVIFPSIIQHRVKKVKSGERFSLVGWMGGPPFK
jgi:PKHD-type hydroxylase